MRNDVGTAQYATTVALSFSYVQPTTTQLPVEILYSSSPDRNCLLCGSRGKKQISKKCGIRRNNQKARLSLEEKWYALTGRVVDAKVEADGDIHLVPPQNNLLIKKLPPPTPDRCERRLFPPEQKQVATRGRIDQERHCLILV